MSDFGEFVKLGADMQNAGRTRIPDLARKVVRKSVLDVERDGRAETPVETGNLQGSWSSSFAGSNATLAQGETGPTADYAEYVNDGTSRQPPNPFVWRALDRNTPAFIAAVEQMGGEILD